MTAATIPRSRLIRYTAEQITAHRAVATGLCIAGALPLQLISKYTYRAYDEEGNNPSFRTVEHNPTKLRKSGYWLRWKTAASIYPPGLPNPFAGTNQLAFSCEHCSNFVQVYCNQKSASKPQHYLELTPKLRNIRLTEGEISPSGFLFSTW